MKLTITKAERETIKNIAFALSGQETVEISNRTEKHRWGKVSDTDDGFELFVKPEVIEDVIMSSWKHFGKHVGTAMNMFASAKLLFAGLTKATKDYIKEIANKYEDSFVVKYVRTDKIIAAVKYNTTIGKVAGTISEYILKTNASEAECDIMHGHADDEANWLEVLDMVEFEPGCAFLKKCSDQVVAFGTFEMNARAKSDVKKYADSFVDHKEVL